MARFMRRGTAKIYFLPTVAGYVAGTPPTSVEVTAGTDITGKIADMSGWLMESGSIDVPDMGARFAKKIPGEQTIADSSLTLYGDDGTVADPVKTALATDTLGYMYICHSGKGVGKPADLFPVRVSSVGNEYSVGADPARYVVTCAVNDIPQLDKPQL